MSQTGSLGRIVIAGGNGFLGTSLAVYLANLGYDVLLLCRRVPRQGPWRHVLWDARTLGAWHRELNHCVGLVNLVGRSVDCIKTPDHQDEILRSRVESTLVLGKAMIGLDTPPPVWVQMSTAHIYGDPPEVRCNEDSALGMGLAPFVGRAWEQAFQDAVLPDQRQVVLRTGFVIGRDGGALSRLRLLVRMGLGGTVASGKQGMSWIHQEDMNRIFERALQDASMSGIYNSMAPNPVSQREFMRSLRTAMRMPIGLPAMGWMVRLGAPLVMRTDPELALYGRYVLPARLMSEGFEFRYPALEPALADLLK